MPVLRKLCDDNKLRASILEKDGYEAEQQVHTEEFIVEKGKQLIAESKLDEEVDSLTR